MSDMNPLVSIIIPVYNVEDYLSESLDSVLMQTYKNLEIILLDDGSTDNSGKLCDEYAKKDSRIAAKHVENGGLANARNVSLANVNGEYIMFVDSDDFVSPYYVEASLDVALKTGADIVCTNAVKFIDKVPETGKHAETKAEVYSGEEAVSLLFYQKKFNNSAWSKLLKTSVIREITFPVGRIYEDLATTYRWFLNSGKIAYLDQTLYFYRQRSGSIMRLGFNDRKYDRVAISSEIRNYISDNYPSIKKASDVRWFLSNLQYLMELPFDKKYKEKRKEVFLNIREVRGGILKDKNTKTSLKLMAASTYPGAGFTMLLGRAYNFFINKKV